MGGLYLVVQPTGAKAWCVRFRHRGQPRKLTLGGWPGIDLKTARELAAKALRRNAEGIDPAREKILARAAQVDSVDRIVEEFLQRHVRRSNRPRTQEETTRIFSLHVLPRWRGRLIRDIKRHDVIDLIDRIVGGGSPVSANRTLTAIKTLFNWAIARDIVTSSPAQGLRPPTIEKSRDRVLDDAELKQVWEAAGQLGHPFGTMVQLLIASGQRRDEVSKMRRDELNLDFKIWALARERVKSGRAHVVPLSTLAVAVLKSIPRVDGSPFVLTTNGAAPASNFAKNKRKLDALLPDMPEWRLHDLRRTCASGMARLGVPVHVTEAVLNHQSGTISGVTAVYNRYDYQDKKAEALEAWGRHVEALISGKPAKVIRFGKRT
jgi:integrase